jgi:outer membrane protein TolC
MRSTLFIIFYLAMCSAACAQGFSIDDLWNSFGSYEKLKQANTQLSIADIKLKAEKGTRLPLIYADGNLQRNLIIPSTPVPAIAFNPNANPGDILPLQFATDWSAKVGLQFSMDLFNPAKSAAIKSVALDKKAAQLDYEQTLKDWKKNATIAYGKVVVSSKQYLEAVADSAAYAEILAVVSERTKAGRASALDLNRAKQELLRKQTQLAEAYRVLEVANIELSDYAETNKYKFLSSSVESIVQKLRKGEENIALERLAVDRDKVELQQKSLKLQALPSFTLNAFYGSQYFNNDFALLNREHWYGNSYVNVGFRLPISEAADRALKKRQLVLEKQLVGSRYREQMEIDASSRKTQEANVRYASKVLENARTIETVSSQNVDLVASRYKAGKILLTELNEELSARFKNRQEVWKAEYDYLLAVLETL